MSREDLYYDEYFERWELSSKEMDEFENTIYNQALKDFYSECERVSDYGALSVLAMNELKDILVKLIK